jgi:D-alanine transaminase
MITYFNGSFLLLEDVHISPFDRGFQFADGVYEALITYNGKLFLYDEHLERFKRSLKEINLNFTGIDGLKWIIYELIKRNNLEEASVYLQITRGARYPRQHIFPGNETKPTIFISVTEVKKAGADGNHGVKVILENDFRWGRCDIKSLMLLPSVMAKQKASENGAYEALWVRDGFLKEGSHTNLFVVKDEAVFTPPLSNTILPGITRHYVLELCRANNIEVYEEEIEASGLREFSEIFITGTTTEIKPVIHVDDIVIGNGKPGKITSKIRKLFLKGIKQG